MDDDEIPGTVRIKRKDGGTMKIIQGWNGVLTPADRERLRQKYRLEIPLAPVSLTDRDKAIAERVARSAYKLSKTGIPGLIGPGIEIGQDYIRQKFPAPGDHLRRDYAMTYLGKLIGKSRLPPPVIVPVSNSGLPT